MNFNQLRYIVVTAEEQNITAAARRLFIAQPSLSQAIRAVERSIGTELFDRTKSPLQLTPAGEIFVNWARQIIRMEQQTRMQIDDVTGGSKQLLRIGASAHHIQMLVMPVLAEFHRQFPNCVIHLYEGSASHQHIKLEQEEIDIMIGPNEPDTFNYTSTLISTEHPMLAVPASMLIPESLTTPSGDDLFRIVNLADYKDASFIALTEDQTFGRFFRTCCTSSGFIPNIIAECNYIETLHEMVSSGLGIGLVTEDIALKNVNSKEVFYFRLAEYTNLRQIFAVHRNDTYLTNPERAFIRMIRDMSEDNRWSFLNPV